MLSLIVSLAPGSSSDDIFYTLSRDVTPRPEGMLTDDEELGGEALPEHGSAPLALLPGSTEVVAVIPAQLLSWHLIARPRVNKARMRLALEGVLEERLLDEPKTFHFALAPSTSPEGLVWVAACDRVWLQEALQALESAGQPVTRIVPEHTPLQAGGEPALHVVGSTEIPWVVHCADNGVQMLPLQASTIALLDLTAESPQPTAEPAVAALAETVLGRAVRVVHPAQTLVLAARSGWDLAQFDLALHGRARAVKRLGKAWAQWTDSAAWRPARWGLAALVVVYLGGLNAWAWKERASLQAKREQIRSLLLASFPKIPVVVDAPLQMEREVAALRLLTGAVSNRDLEPMMAKAAESLPAGSRPTAIDFKPGELTLRGLQLPDEQARAFTQALSAAGYSTRSDADSWTVQASTAGRADRP